MKKIVCKDYADLSKTAAAFIAQQLERKPDSILGLATGSTPVGTYKELIALGLDFSKVTTFNLDEYYPIARSNPQSYYAFMEENLFKHININRANINIPNGESSDAAAECASYDERLIAAGGTDLQILGIGNNGHIAFVEPDVALPLSTNIVSLAEDTIAANARFFDNPDEVPRQALSMGLGGIFNSRHIILLISGKGKAEIAAKLFNESERTVTCNIPASLLKLHPNVTVIIDEDANG